MSEWSGFGWIFGSEFTCTQDLVVTSKLWLWEALRICNCNWTSIFECLFPYSSFIHGCSRANIQTSARGCAQLSIKPNAPAHRLRTRLRIVRNGNVVRIFDRMSSEHCQLHVQSPVNFDSSRVALMQWNIIVLTAATLQFPAKSMDD